MVENRLTCPLKQCCSDLQGVWGRCVKDFMGTDVGQSLALFVDAKVRSASVVYPATPFLALTLTPFENVCVVILGQDPYHGAGQAQGLAFSVAESIKTPPSLRNMFKELQRDLNAPLPPDGSLLRWASQGVLLLNATLTVEDGCPASHAKKGWETLTDTLIQTVALKEQPLVFMLWGAHAQKKEAMILEAMQHTGVSHLILKANHPSPLSATKPPVPFIGCGHFSLANQFLQRNGLEPIAW
ncbi:MAG: uracil-DNA glycosylase [Saezia sp.]